MKGLLKIVICCAVLLSCTGAAAGTFAADTSGGGSAGADSAGLKIGDYILMGKYNDQPILWRFVDEDEIGKLILSDKILCKKIFGGNNFWEESSLRTWLNSTVAEGDVKWEIGRLYSTVTKPFDEETGFLNEDNFTLRERRTMKTVSQWTMLPKEHLGLATNGKNNAYNAVKGIYPGNPRDGGGGKIYFDISEIPGVYSGAAYEISDTVFLLDEMQIYRIWKNFGTVMAKSTEESNYSSPYYLRTPTDYEESCTAIDYVGNYCISGYGGVRPAFYLNTDNAEILSGSGTAEEPYVLNGKKKDGISVYCNGWELAFDQPPVMENDRVLVPMRAIFEALGAQVSWDGGTQTVTATKGDTVITLQIGRQSMIKNGKIIVLDTAAKLVGDRTLVPVRAVSEGLGASVAWNEEENTVEIVAN